MKFNLNTVTPSIPSSGFKKGDYFMVVEAVEEAPDSKAGNPQARISYRLKGNDAYDNRYCSDFITISPVSEDDKATAILVNTLLALDVELPELDGKDMQAIQRQLRKHIVENVTIDHTVSAFLDEDEHGWLQVVVYHAPAVNEMA